MSNDRDDEGDVTMELSMSDVMNISKNDNRGDDPFISKTLQLGPVTLTDDEDAGDPEVTITHERPAHVETTTELPIVTKASAGEQASIMSESTVEFDPSAYIAQARRATEEPTRPDVHDAVTSVLSANEVLFAAEQWEGVAEESSYVSEVEHTSTYDASDIAALMQHHDNEHVPLQLDERTQEYASARDQLTKGQMSFVVQVDEEGKITLPEKLRAAMVPGERVRISIIFLED